MKAQILIGGPLQEACPNCGTVSGADEVIAKADEDAGGFIGWRGCSVCWPWILQRGQLDVIKMLMRAKTKT